MARPLRSSPPSWTSRNSGKAACSWTASRTAAGSKTSRALAGSQTRSFTVAGCLAAAWLPVTVVSPGAPAWKSPVLGVDLDDAGVGALEGRHFGDQLDVAAGAGGRQGELPRLAGQAERAIDVHPQGQVRIGLDRLEDDRVGLRVEVAGGDGQGPAAGLQGGHFIAPQFEPGAALAALSAFHFNRSPGTAASRPPL